MATFFGGKRVCFGKALAEAEMKLLHIYMTQLFEFEYEDARYEERVHLAQLDMSL